MNNRYKNYPIITKLKDLHDNGATIDQISLALNVSNAFVLTMLAELFELETFNEPDMVNMK